MLLHVLGYILAGALVVGGIVLVIRAQIRSGGPHYDSSHAEEEARRRWRRP